MVWLSAVPSSLDFVTIAAADSLLMAMHHKVATQVGYSQQEIDLYAVPGQYLLGQLQSCANLYLQLP